MRKESQVVDASPMIDNVIVVNALPELLDDGYGLCRRPPYAILETHTVRPAENGFETSAMVLIPHALEEITHVEKARRQANYYLDLAALQVALGQDPAEMVTQGINLAPEDNVDGSVLAAERAATILAYSGDFTSALEMARLASGKRYRKAYPLRNLARTIYKLGGDHNPPFEESLAVLSDETQWHRDCSGQGDSILGLSVLSYIKTAEAVRLFGGDYTHFLDKAEELLSEGGLDFA